MSFVKPYHSNLRTMFACGLAIAATTTTSQAGLISISAGTLSTNGSEITGGATTTEVAVAWNVMDDDGTDVVVQGVNFTTLQPGSITLDFGTSPSGNGTFANNELLYSGNMEQLMEAVKVTDDADGGNPAIGTVNISGLTTNQQYRVQMLHHQDINNDGDARNMQVFFGDVNGDSTGFFNVGNDQGYITTVDFTADGSSQLFTLASVAGESERATLNGIAVFTVPEPGSLALLGLGGLLVARRRRD